MIRLSTITLMIAAICGLCMAIGPATATTWDATAEFSLTTNGGTNVWSYGYCDEGQLNSNAFTAYTVSRTFAGVLPSWSMDNNDGLSKGAIWKNPTADVLYCPWPAVFAGNQLGYHSGVADRARPTIRWTAPETGWMLVEAMVSGADYADVTSTEGHIRHNGVVLWSDNVNGYGGTPPGYGDAFVDPFEGAKHTIYYSGTIFVNAGDVIDLVGGAQIDIPGDSTRLAYSITTVPEPSSLVAVFTALVGFGGLAIRRRKP